MLHLHQCTSLPQQIPSPSINITRSSRLTRFGFPVHHDRKAFLSKKSTITGEDDDGYHNVRPLNAVDKESEFEIDPDKAREALRKLDEQFQSLSKKQVNPPKIRASELSRSNPAEKEEISELSGSFLGSLATGLIIFTIIYNVIFYTVIKPSIDDLGQESESSVIDDAQRQTETNTL